MKFFIKVLPKFHKTIWDNCSCIGKYFFEASRVKGSTQIYFFESFDKEKTHPSPSDLEKYSKEFLVP